jgi:hypothetical protein
MWALKKCDCWADTPAPSLLVIFRLVAKAAASQASAMRMASAELMAQGWNRSRSG